MPKDADRPPRRSHPDTPGRADEAPMKRPRGAQLKSALLRHARKMVELDGPDGLSLRAVAKTAGVTQTAPYIYFPDGVTELHAAVAIEGFEHLIQLIERSPRSASPVARVREIVLRYVRFGVEHPNLYRAMFHSRLAGPLSNPHDRADGAETYEALSRLKADTFQLLVEPLERLKDANALRPGDPKDFGLALAALAHGLVGEFIDEGLGHHASRSTPWSQVRRSTAEEITDMLLYGLLASPSSRAAYGD